MVVAAATRAEGNLLIFTWRRPDRRMCVWRSSSAKLPAELLCALGPRVSARDKRGYRRDHGTRCIRIELQKRDSEVVRVTSEIPYPSIPSADFHNNVVHRSSPVVYVHNSVGVFLPYPDGCWEPWVVSFVNQITGFDTCQKLWTTMRKYDCQKR